MDEQALLLQIVKSWNISPTPQYRGFRCAACQEYKNESWYHWLYEGGFLVPVHLCDDTCHVAFLSGALQLASQPPSQTINLTNPYSPKAIGTCEELVEEWNTLAQPVLKAFACDLCEKDLDIDPEDSQRKGFHVWYLTKNNHKAELHFHKDCWNSLCV